MNSALFGVSRSGYYDHLNKGKRQRRQEDQELGQQIEVIFQASGHSYGSPRLVDALHDQGLCCGKNRVYRLMNERVDERTWPQGKAEAAFPTTHYRQ